MSASFQLLIIIGLTLLAFISNRWRYDLVAGVALTACVLLGLVSHKGAFSGFSSPAVVTVAAIMVLSKAISDSGILNLFIDKVFDKFDSFTVQLGLLSIIAVVLSAFMNNIGALALLMPIAIRIAVANNRSPSLFLMPIALSSALGGLITMIGTPPNILISMFRFEATGQSYQMFSFAPVGIVVALFGVSYVVFLGWRLLPKRKKSSDEKYEAFKLKGYITEVKVTKKSLIKDWTVREFELDMKERFSVVSIIRGRKKRLKISVNEQFCVGDIVLLEGDHHHLNDTVHKYRLSLVADENISSEMLKSKNIDLVEAVVSRNSRLSGMESGRLRLRSRYQVNLVAIAREGNRFRKRLNKIRLKAGDVVLLQGYRDQLSSAIKRLGLLPLRERGFNVSQKKQLYLPIIAFVLAVAASVAGIVPIWLALVVAILLLALFNVISIPRIYDNIDFSIIFLLGLMIPIGGAFQSTGATHLVANLFLQISSHFSVPILLGCLLLITMTLSDVMNNVATTVIMAPIAIGIANTMQLNVDPFLMTVAVGASCSFLTPIGHQNNILVMGPGGYKFSDYIRVGFLLELIVIAVAIPMILWVWPLHHVLV